MCYLFAESIELHSFSLGDNTPFIKYMQVYECVGGEGGGCGTKRRAASWAGIIQPPAGLPTSQQFQIVLEAEVGLHCEDFKMIFRTRLGGKWSVLVHFVDSVAIETTASACLLTRFVFCSSSTWQRRYPTVQGNSAHGQHLTYSVRSSNDIMYQRGSLTMDMIMECKYIYIYIYQAACSTHGLSIECSATIVLAWYLKLLHGLDFISAWLLRVPHYVVNSSMICRYACTCVSGLESFIIIFFTLLTSLLVQGYDSALQPSSWTAWTHA